jgi:hypothetical protein
MPIVQVLQAKLVVARKKVADALHAASQDAKSLAQPASIGRAGEGVER